MKASAFFAALLLLSCAPRGPDPELERQRLELERAKLEQSNIEKCTAQVERAVQHFKADWAQFGKEEAISSSNHYNKKLGKCFGVVDIIGGGKSEITTTTVVLDAYENTTLASCFSTNIPRTENCLKAGKSVATAEVHKLIGSYLESEYPE